MADAQVDKPRSLSRETCLYVVQKHLFRTTSNWLYVWNLQKHWEVGFIWCVLQAYFVYESFTVVFMVEDFFMHTVSIFLYSSLGICKT